MHLNISVVFEKSFIYFIFTNTYFWCQNRSTLPNERKKFYTSTLLRLSTFGQYLPSPSSTLEYQEESRNNPYLFFQRFSTFCCPFLKGVCTHLESIFIYVRNPHSPRHVTLTTLSWARNFSGLKHAPLLVNFEKKNTLRA